MPNPFLLDIAEDINPDDFKKIYVEEPTWTNTLESPKDVIIFGSRGSGKSMLLKYLDIEHRLKYYNNDLENFINKKRLNRFIGTLIPLQIGAINSHLYDTIEKNIMVEFLKELCTTDVILYIVYNIVTNFLNVNQLKQYIAEINTKKLQKFSIKCHNELFNKKSQIKEKEILMKNVKKIKKNDKIFLQLIETITYRLNEISEYLKRRIQNRDLIYEGIFLDYRFLRIFIINLKEILNFNNFSFYILLDNGDRVSQIVQHAINDLIYQRDHKDICIKVAVKTGVHWDMKGIQSPHDFNEIDIDDLYTKNHIIYLNRVKDIANMRLKSLGFSTSIEDFLPDSADEEELLSKIRKKMRKEFEEKFKKEQSKLPPNMTMSKYVGNRVSKYAKAEFFIELSNKGIRPKYAGFRNIVHLSSGVIRQFLELCRKMYELQEEKTGDCFNSISIGVQEILTKRYANEFMDLLYNRYKMRKEGGYNDADDYLKLYKLIEALGNYYRKRLFDTNIVDRRIFTFTLKDSNTDNEVERILNLGLNENYLQCYWFSSKTGKENYKGYPLNRRLCPRFKIDHSSFRGRIELFSSDVKKAIKTGKLSKSSFHLDEEQQSMYDYLEESEDE